MVEQMKSKETDEQREKRELLDKIGKIIKDHGGVESNIPLTHEYWALLGQFRTHK